MPPNGITKVGVRNVTFHCKVFSFFYDDTNNVQIQYEKWIGKNNILYHKNGQGIESPGTLSVTDGFGNAHTLLPGTDIVLKDNVGKAIKIQ